MRTEAVSYADSNSAAYANSYSNDDSHSHRYAYGDGYCYCYCDSHSYTYSLRRLHPDQRHYHGRVRAQPRARVPSGSAAEPNSFAERVEDNAFHLVDRLLLKTMTEQFAEGAN